MDTPGKTPPEPALTWEFLLNLLSHQFGEDIAQDVMLSYLKNNKQIQHSLKYFRKSAKNARLMRCRRSAFRLVSKSDKVISAIPTGAQQLTRCLLLEVWQELTTEQRERALAGPNSPADHKTSTARVRLYRLRKKL